MIAQIEIAGYPVSQFALVAMGLIGLVAVAVWRSEDIAEAIRKHPQEPDQWPGEDVVAIDGGGPVVSDSDRPAPPGAKQWIREILEAVDGAPESLKLEVLLDGSTTVASAQRRYIEYLRSKPAGIRGTQPQVVNTPADGKLEIRE